MVFSVRGFSFLTPVDHPGGEPGSTGQAGFTGLLGSSFFFPFPEEREKENPLSAEGVVPFMLFAFPGWFDVL